MSEQNKEFRELSGQISSSLRGKATPLTDDTPHEAPKHNTNGYRVGEPHPSFNPDEEFDYDAAMHMYQITYAPLRNR